MAKDTATDMSAGLAATSFVPYFSYAGLLHVSGSVRATEADGDTSIVMWYDLEGVDGGCNGGPDRSRSWLPLLSW